MKTQKSLRGYIPLCRVLAMMPATTGDVAAKMKCSRYQAGKFLRHLRAVRLVHCVAMVPVEGTRSAREAKYNLGDEPSIRIPGGKPGTPERPPTVAIMLAAVVRLLRDGPALVSDIAEDAGLSRMVTLKVINTLSALDLARIGDWTHVPCALAPMWVWGGGRNARRPPKTPRNVVNARHWLRRRERMRAQLINDALAGRIAA